jgi:hypothetical protein
MPQRKTVERARKAKRAGKSASTQAGEFVREQIRKVRRRKHGARSPQQAIAIGLSEARRAGVGLPPPRKGKAKKATRKSATYAYEAGQRKRTPKRRPRVARAVSGVTKKEPRTAVSRAALSRRAKAAAARRKKTSRRAPAFKRAASAAKSASKRAAATKRPAAKRVARPSAPARRASRARKRHRTWVPG